MEEGRSTLTTADRLRYTPTVAEHQSPVAVRRSPRGRLSVLRRKRLRPGDVERRPCPDGHRARLQPAADRPGHRVPDDGGRPIASAVLRVDAEPTARRLHLAGRQRSGLRRRFAAGGSDDEPDPDRRCKRYAQEVGTDDVPVI